MNLDARDVIGGQLEWLLELRHGDDIIRLAREPVDAPDGDGNTVTYHGGLEFSEQVDTSINPYGDSPDGRSVDLTLHIDGMPARVESGFDLGTTTGRLWLWAKNTDKLSLYIDGSIRGVEYGNDEEAVTCSLEEVIEDDAGLFPDADARVTAKTWPNAVSKAMGEFYPFVLGKPGSATVYPTPALYVDTGGNDQILIAGHPVDAATVAVINDSDGTSAAGLPVIHTYDGLGRQVAVVELAMTGITIDIEAQYFVSWSAGGGLVDGDGSMVRGAGSVVEWMLRYSAVRQDAGRLSAARHTLDGILIDTYVMAKPDERIKPWGWLADNIIPLLPVSVALSFDGFYLAVHAHDADSGAAITHIEASNSGHTRAVRTSPVSYSDTDELASEFVMLYANDAREDQFGKRLVLTGDPESTDTDAVPNATCLVARTRQRHPKTLEESSDVLWDGSSALAALLRSVRRYALPSRMVEYSVDIEIAGHLEPGELVTLTDAGLSWERKLFMVESITWSLDGVVNLGLRSVESVARDLKLQAT